jgi:putative DNA primase/helicase
MRTRDIERARKALTFIPPGLPREEWHEVLRGGKAAGLTDQELIEWSARGHNYKGAADVRAALKGITPEGKTGAGTLYYIAAKYGFPLKGKRAAKLEFPPYEHASPVVAQPAQDIAAVLAEVAAACEPASTAHPYIKQKLGITEGMHVYRGIKKIAGHNCNGALVLPLNDLEGQPVSMQFITNDGAKVFLPGIEIKPEACLVIGGELANAKKAYVVEGVGQAWSAHLATRAPAIICFGKGRMAGVAKAVHHRYPDLLLVIVPDAGGQHAGH